MTQITLSTGRVVHWGVVKNKGVDTLDIHYEHLTHSALTEEEKLEAVNAINQAMHGTGEEK